jgi:hypothetical protein
MKLARRLGLDAGGIAGAAAGIAVIALLLAAAFGWGWNIVKLVGMDGVSGLMVGRVIGIFVAPVGAILGYI